MIGVSTDSSETLTVDDYSTSQDQVLVESNMIGSKKLLQVLIDQNFEKVEKFHICHAGKNPGAKNESIYTYNASAHN